jgi:hypothetical protein
MRRAFGQFANDRGGKVFVNSQLVVNGQAHNRF